MNRKRKRYEPGDFSLEREGIKILPVPSFYRGVTQFSSDGIKIRDFISAASAGREYGIPRQSIGDVCRGRNKTSGGFKWAFTDANSRKILKVKKRRKTKGVTQHSIDGKEIKKFRGAIEASKEMCCDPTTIYRACLEGRKCRNSLWSFDGSLIRPCYFDYPIKQLSCSPTFIVRTFKNYQEASKMLGIPEILILNICFGIESFSFFKLKFDRPPKMRVAQISLETGEILSEFKSIRIAASSVKGCSARNISGVCKNRIKSAGGYGWAYV